MQVLKILGAAGAALVLAACAHGAKSSSSSTTTQSVQTSPSAAGPMATVTAGASAMPSAAASPGGVAAAGAAVYAANCAACHQAAGQGVPGTFPPLAGNPVASGPAGAMIHIVKDGLAKPITVNGQSYNGEMPAWGGRLSTTDIAAVITYVRHSWGNAGSAVTPAQVASTP